MRSANRVMQLSMLANTVLVFSILPFLVVGQQPVTPERIAEFKQSLQHSQA